MTIAKLFFSMALLIACVTAQTWSGSGSNGSDGALNLNASTPGVVNNLLIFDPVALNLDADGDNIFHFTTVTISGNITVKFRANKMRAQRPVIWLATGAVNIAGILDLNGEAGHPGSVTGSVRRPSEPGPGGFPGGVGALVGGVAQPGVGPGGGKVAVPASWGCSAGFAAAAVLPNWCTVGGSLAYGNTLLQPLIGGSGGSGATSSSPNFGSGGGAGGGAIRISSNVHISFGTGINGNQAVACSSNYYIISDGGSGGSGGNTAGGGGSGGAVHLQAPVVAGCTTHLWFRAGSGPSSQGAAVGRARIDANGITVGTNPVPALTGPLVDVPLPTSQPSIRVISVNGVNVPANPEFGYTVPDLNLNTTAAVPVVVNAANIPVNTPVTLYLSTEPGGSDVTTTVNLTGSLSNSTATANVTLPTGVSRMYVRAVW